MFEECQIFITYVYTSLGQLTWPKHINVVTITDLDIQIILFTLKISDS